MATTERANRTLALIESGAGQALIPPGPLTRLNYFDGKFLRADDLRLEQDYVRLLVQTSNLAGGEGVVYGFDATLDAGDQLTLGPGLAVDARGRLLLLPSEYTTTIGDLLRRTDLARLSKSSGGNAFAECEPVSLGDDVDVPHVGEYFVICISHAQAWCGHEDVYGRLCEDACITETDRPYINEGIVLQAVPLSLTQPLVTSRAVSLTRTHLRSRLASALFRQEAASAPACLISRPGLSANVWCLGAELSSWFDCGVPLAVIARSGDTTFLLDAWAVRRERIEPPAQRYWAWRMCMRPWDVYLAQILQFQCQLTDLLLRHPTDTEDDPCAPAHTVLSEAGTLVDELIAHYKDSGTAERTLSSDHYDRVQLLGKRLSQAVIGRFPVPRNQVLIDGGIVELPPAGYLPVDPTSTLTVNDQVRRLVGKGLDLRFCTVRPDFVAHALEEAQHMERISLLHGLDHPDDLPKVDVLVPNGRSIPTLAMQGDTYEATLEVGAPTGSRSMVGGSEHHGLKFVGAARNELSPTGAWTFAAAAGYPQLGFDGSAEIGKFNAPSVWLTIHTERHLLALREGDATTVTAWAADSMVRFAAERRVQATLTVLRLTTLSDGSRRGVGHLSGYEWDPREDQSGSSQGGPVELDVTYSIGPDERGLPSVTATGTIRGVAYTFELAWGGTPLTAVAMLTRGLRAPTVYGRVAMAYDAGTMETGEEGQPTTWESTQPTGTPTPTPPPQPEIGTVGRFVRNPDVAALTNPMHRTAMSALQTLGLALQDSTFVGQTARILFPPIQPATENTVQATLDWVLFHRRREEDCGPAQAPVALRRYQVYVSTPNRLAMRTVRSTEGGMVPRPVTVVEFAADGDQVLAQPADLQEAWRNAGAGTLIVAAAVASDTDDDAQLLIRRVGSLETALSPSVSVVPTAETTVVTTRPFLDPRGTDGVIDFVTMAPTPTPTPTPTPAPAPVELLQVERVRILNAPFEHPTVNAKILAEMKDPRDGLKVNMAAGPTTIEVRFTGPPLDFSSVVEGVTFILMGPVEQKEVVAMPDQTVRLVVDRLRQGSYKVILKERIVTVNGIPLDGDVTDHLPSGDDQPGGDFVFDLEIIG